MKKYCVLASRHHLANNILYDLVEYKEYMPIKMCGVKLYCVKRPVFESGEIIYTKIEDNVNGEYYRFAPTQRYPDKTLDAFAYSKYFFEAESDDDALLLFNLSDF